MAVCRTCNKALAKKELPKNALVNDTWQGLIPPELQCKDPWHEDGLNPVEQSLICILNPITSICMLPSGAHFICPSKTDNSALRTRRLG